MSMVKSAFVLIILSAVVAQSGVEIADPGAAAKLLPNGAAVEKLAGGLQFVEGPVWIDADGGYLVFSDIPANELKRWDRAGGVRTFRSPSGNTNGNTLDPTYGIGTRKQETKGNYVYRFDPARSALTAVVRDAVMPNGLCFSADERTLYVADSGKPRHIRAFSVDAQGAVDQSRVFATIDKGGPDGIRCDEFGNVWSSSGDGVQIFSPSGALIARILLPESAANLAFGGPQGRTLFMTARTSLYAIETLVRDGARIGQ